MAMAKNVRQRTSKLRRTIGKCYFCEQRAEPDYKDVKVLMAYVTDKGKIVSRSRTGTCQKHQRALSAGIKRARQMALIPFVSLLG
jgi:small subunit ribosomal protein S18